MAKGAKKMREILFKGKRSDNGEWVQGSPVDSICGAISKIEFYDGLTDCETVDVIPETVGQYTGLTDKNGTKIFEGDIVQYNTFDDFDCQSVVKIGRYKQDGSGGEYKPRECYGTFVEVDNFTCPDWAENNPDCFPEYLVQQNLLEVTSVCEIIGNIYDNPNLLKK